MNKLKIDCSSDRDHWEGDHSTKFHGIVSLSLAFGDGKPGVGASVMTTCDRAAFELMNTSN